MWCWGRICTLVSGKGGVLRCEEVQLPDMRDFNIRRTRPRKAKTAAAGVGMEEQQRALGKTVGQEAADKAAQQKRRKDEYNRRSSLLLRLAREALGGIRGSVRCGHASADCCVGLGVSSRYTWTPGSAWGA